MSSALRILVLNYEYPPLGGGAGIVTKHLAERLAARGYEVHVVTTWFSGEPEFSSEGNLTIVRLRSKRKYTYKSNPFEMLSWARQALKYFRQLPNEKLFDICLANFTLPGGLVARYVKKRWQIPYVILSHGHDIPWFAPRQMMPWHLLAYPFIKRIIRQSEKNILLTAELKQIADHFIGSKFLQKNVVIPNGMLMDQYKAGFNTPDQPMQILFVGRLVEQKDPMTFIRACKLINDMNLPVHFTMIGDGPLKISIEKLVLHSGIRNIDIMGKVSHYDVLRAYEKADVLILPSREEAMSMVVLEAVSRGLYVITTPVSGNKGLIQEQVNGDFVSYGNEQEIVNALADFYFNKFSKGYQYPPDIIYYLFDRYSWDKVVDNYIALFESICGRPEKVNALN